VALGKIAVFVGIVWTVAASFVAFEFAALRGMDVVLAHPTLFGSLLLANATRNSTACDVAAAPQPLPAGVDRAAIRGAAWSLGQRVGLDAQAAMSSTVTPEALRASAHGIAELTGVLGVPAPPRFTPAAVVNANTEFVTFIETDAAHTAHQLATAYSPEACRLYKLAAFWAYAGLARMSLPGERNIYAVEISYYATRLGLPATLWRAYIEPTGSGMTAQQINRQTMELTGEVTKYLLAPVE